MTIIVIRIERQDGSIQQYRYELKKDGSLGDLLSYFDTRNTKWVAI